MGSPGRSDSTTSRTLRVKQQRVLTIAHQFMRPSSFESSTPVLWWMVPGSSTSSPTTTDSSTSWNVASITTIQTGAPPPLLLDPFAWSQISRTAKTRFVEFQRPQKLKMIQLQNCEVTWVLEPSTRFQSPNTTKVTNYLQVLSSDASKVLEWFHNLETSRVLEPLKWLRVPEFETPQLPNCFSHQDSCPSPQSIALQWIKYSYPLQRCLYSFVLYLTPSSLVI